MTSIAVCLSLLSEGGQKKAEREHFMRLPWALKASGKETGMSLRSSILRTVRSGIKDKEIPDH